MSENTYVVLFADISGSMQLYGRLGDEAAKSLVTELQARLSLVVEQCGGVVQEIVGDEIMARFVQPDAAVQCAASIHQSAQEFSALDPLFMDPTSGVSQVQMRIGMHWGLAIVEQGRMFGDTVNVASRVSSIAQGGQTITTEALIAQLSPPWRQTARQFDTAKVKGKKDPLIIFDLPWQPDGVTEINLLSDASCDGNLVLTYAGDVTQVGVDDGMFTIGRALNNNLVVDAGPVSRRHVIIERERDRFVVSDQSTNGTHVYIQGGETVYLRRQQLPLWGKGHLALGAPAPGAIDTTDSSASGMDTAHVVGYACVSNDN